MSDNAVPLPDFTRWPSFPFEGEMRVKQLLEPVDVEPPRHGEDAADCVACHTPDEAYIWVSERWRVRAMDRPTGLPMVLILESRSHLDLGDLPNLLAAELGVMTVRLERAVRSLDGVARVHVNRWGDGSAHLHLWFLARPYGRLQLRGTFLSLWDDILPEIPEYQWRENLALVAAWLAEFGGRPLAEPPHIQWQSPSTIPSHLPTEPAEESPTAPVDADATIGHDDGPGPAAGDPADKVAEQGTADTGSGSAARSESGEGMAVRGDSVTGAEHTVGVPDSSEEPSGSEHRGSEESEGGGPGDTRGAELAEPSPAPDVDDATAVDKSTAPRTEADEKARTGGSASRPVGERTTAPLGAAPDPSEAVPGSASGPVDGSAEVPGVPTSSEEVSDSRGEPSTNQTVDLRGRFAGGSSSAS